jgi:hypothetical protein
VQIGFPRICVNPNPKWLDARDLKFLGAGRIYLYCLNFKFLVLVVGWELKLGLVPIRGNTICAEPKLRSVVCINVQWTKSNNMKEATSRNLTLRDAHAFAQIWQLLTLAEGRIPECATKLGLSITTCTVVLCMVMWSPAYKFIYFKGEVIHFARQRICLAYKSLNLFWSVTS